MSQAGVRLYHDAGDLGQITAAGDRAEAVAERIRKVVSESAIGRSLLSVAWLRAICLLFIRLLFRRDIDAGLKHLQHHSLEESEVVALESRARGHIQQLAQARNKRLERVATGLAFLG